MKDAVDLLSQRITELEKENEQLQQALLEMRMTADAESEDAERLRWINLHTYFTNLGPGFYEMPTLVKGNAKSLREAIDAARRE